MTMHDALPEAGELVLPGSRNSRIIYWLIISMILSGILMLPFIVVDITVQADGIIRPSTERTPVRSMAQGLIDSIYYREGDYVEQGMPIATMEDNTSGSWLPGIDEEIRQRQEYIRDLNTLLKVDTLSPLVLTSIVSPFYTHAARRYLYESANQLATIRKVNKEMKTTTALFKDGVISQKEYDDKSIEAAKQFSTYQAFRHHQLETWQLERGKIRSELTQWRANRNQRKAEQSRFVIKAPVSGTLMGLNSRYPGSWLQPGETLCEVSPEGELIAECYLMTRHIAFVQPGQQVTFRLEAFDQNYFSALSGTVTSIDNDYTISDNKAVYTVRCKLATNSLFLKNNYEGHLKKGLALQARFIVAKRSLSDLIFDKINDWLNPVSS